MKPSNLTRNVFRAILSNRPYTTAGCRKRSRLPPRLRPPNGTLLSRHQRTLFGFAFGSTSNGLNGARNTPANLETALGKLVDLVRARRTHSRLPADDELVDAFRFLFVSRLESPRRLTRNEIFLATAAFNHLQECGLVLTPTDTVGLSAEDLHNVLLALASSTGRDRFRTDARILATAIFDALRPGLSDAAEEAMPAANANSLPQGPLLVTYITVLSKTGSSHEALELLGNSGRSSQRDSLPMWISILKGLANEGHLQEFWEVLSEMEQTAGPLDPTSHEELVVFFADRDEISASKKVFTRPLEDGMQPTTTSLVRLIDSCVRNDELKWAGPLVESLYSRTDAGDIAGTLLLYHAAQDLDAKKIRQKIGELLKRGMAKAITMKEINRLVKYAYAQHLPQVAVDYIDMARSLGLSPDGTSYSMQLDYELKQGDRAAAVRTFELLSREDFPSDKSDVPVLNRYIAALAFSAEHDYELLMRIVDRLLETGAELDAEAIAGLCHVFLERDELEEATNLLRHRVDSLPTDDRARISAVFREFIVNQAVKDQRAFNAYELFRHAFPETSVEDRLPLMRSFFERNRPDLGCLVFGHMRQREDPEGRPDDEAYAQCFEGIARCKDVDGLQMIYNMLKLDLEVEQTTRIHNGLIAAYTACQLPFTAIIDHFWKILESRQGPTLSSFALALRACETWIPQGALEARRIMALMQSWNLIITKEIYDCYIGALAGQSEFENVVELIEEMESDIGEKPDAITIGIFYNAIPWQYRKDEVEAWAKQAYPELWEDLLSFGDEIDEEWEVRYFKIDRSIDIDDEPLFASGEYHPQIALQSQVMLEAPAS